MSIFKAATRPFARLSKLATLAALTLPLFFAGKAALSAESQTKTLYSFSVKKSDGSSQSLSEYKGKVVLVVNVASRCGFTGQYDGLEALYKKHQKDGLMIIGFPSNQFGSQEPGTNQDIQKFCKLQYGVTFPVMAKIDVNGEKADELYKWLKASVPGVQRNKDIPWNFSKFLINQNGEVRSFFQPQVEPKELENEIQKLLASK